MRRDELRQPLKKRGLFERLWANRPSALQAASLAAALVFASAIVWAVRTPYPNAGEPVVTLAIPPAKEVATASTDKPSTASDDTEAEPEAAEAPPPEEDQVIQTQASIIVAPHRALAPAPIAAVTEEGPYGPLPRIGNSKRPL